MFWHLTRQTSCVTCPSGSGYRTVLLIWKAWSRRKPATLNASFQRTHEEHTVCIFSSVRHRDGNPSEPIYTIQQCRKQPALHIFQKVEEDHGAWQSISGPQQRSSCAQQGTAAQPASAARNTRLSQNTACQFSPSYLTLPDIISPAQ